MGVFFQIALRNLLLAKRRTLFMSSALALVTMLLCILLALSAGLANTMIRSATTLSAGHVNVGGWFKAKASDGTPLISDAPPVRKIVEENTPGLDFIVERQHGWARLTSGTGTLQAALSGIEIATESHFVEAIRLAEEAEYKDGGEAKVKGEIRRLGEPHTAMIFVSQAKKLGVGVGDQITLTIETWNGARNTADVEVVAVAKDIGFLSNWNVYLPTQQILDLYKIAPETTGAIMVYLKDPAQAERTMGHLRDVLAAKGYQIMQHDPQAFFMKFETVAGEDWIGQKLDLTVWKDEVSFLTWVLTALNSVSGLLVSILMIIIVIGIMNSMWISVRERTGEVGTLRAIGMSRGRVLIMFLFEALLLGLFATSVGAAVGAGIAAALDAAHINIPVDAVKMILLSDTLHLSVEPGQLAFAILLFTAVTALAALWPALRAARMQPVTAIQNVD